jgi:membrane protein
MKKKLIEIWNFIEKVFDHWIEDKCPKLGAALSFYTIFSLSPLLVIAVSIAGFIFGEEAARGEIVYQIQDLVGKEGAMIVQTALKNSQYSAEGLRALVISAVTLLIGSTVVFVELKDSLNLIWKVKRKPGRSILKVIKGFFLDRFQSFALVVTTGFLLLVSLLVSAFIVALNRFLADTFLSLPLYFFDIADILVSLLVIFISFMMIFRVLPDLNIKWKDVWLGALVTAALFVLGKFLIGLYLGQSTLSSTYGAAGSLVIFLLWIYYSVQILFLGAEFIKVYIESRGRKIEPASKYLMYERSNIEESEGSETEKS